MGKNVTQKLIEQHLVSGTMKPGEEIGIKIDQTLTQDATGTMVMLELEAMDVDKVKTEISVQYVDHNLLQTDFKNADDHIFLQSACEKFGIWYSRAGNGVSHPVHMERFGIPGKTLLGSDSHTPAAGSLGMLAIGAGGLEVGLSMVGLPFYFKMPKVLGVKLIGKLADWVSAKDVILEMLRRHTVKGGVGWIIEYYGDGLKDLSAMDRHVIANMGAELGATTSVFPSDEMTKRFLKSQGRENDWIELKPDEGATYDEYEEIDLSTLEPLIALPSSPDNVVPVKDVVGQEIYQSMVGSSANPGFRDFAIAAYMVKNRQIHPRVSFDINPTSRQILDDLTKTGYLADLVESGARIHQAGCNGCIGMGQAPATKKNSLRTVPRNFPGRSGTKEDAVFLCSPEVATASALTGVITDPRTLGIPYTRIDELEHPTILTEMVIKPPEDNSNVVLQKGPNIQPIPQFSSLSEFIQGPVILKVGNNISTDEILPAGTKVLPFRSNIPEIAKFAFYQVDETFYQRALNHQATGQIIVGGLNYGQGSSREHAAIVPRYLGVKVVIAKSFARIHWQNLINFGILPLTFVDRNDFARIDQMDELAIDNVVETIKSGHLLIVNNTTKNFFFEVEHALTERQIEMLIHGGIINLYKKGLL
ncbi:2,3-dimethylmalate dehydratase large subunit [Candidatus Rubidus massiliensis]|nr:2,3-dimethylmalate dehydratase large subunit [Candidatus Rubidus massiliensis]